MKTYGYEIVQTLIVDIEPDETVKRAMNEINAGIYIYIYIFKVNFIDINSISYNSTPHIGYQTSLTIDICV